VTRTTIAFYVSAHGYGHWAQCAPVIEALIRLRPGLRVLLRSSLPADEVRARMADGLVYEPAEIDVGVVQRSAIEEDIEATRAAIARFYRDWPTRVAREAEWLRDRRVGLVVGNIAPLAFAAAARAGIPSWALGSIDWHAIYQAYLPAHDAALRCIRDAYAQAEWLLQLPLSMDMRVFARRRRIDLIARHADAPLLPAGMPACAKRALVLFGGSGMPAFDVQALASIDDWCFLVPREGGRRGGDWPAHVCAFDPARLPIAGVLRAADVVVCKPGYGTLAEAWVAATPVCFVPRPAFPEYPFLRDWLRRYAPAACLPLAAFRRGAWRNALERARRHPRRYPAVRADGAKQAAALLASRMAFAGQQR